MPGKSWLSEEQEEEEDTSDADSVSFHLEGCSDTTHGEDESPSFQEKRSSVTPYRITITDESRAGTDSRESHLNNAPAEQHFLSVGSSPMHGIGTPLPMNPSESSSPRNLCVSFADSDNAKRLQSLVIPLHGARATAKSVRFSPDNSPVSAMSSTASSKPYGSTRSTFTLPNRQILRATTPSVLLEGLGWRLRSTAGGIGAEAAENEYDKSFPVEFVNMFLSHSWHAKWYLKFLTLLFYFNALAAVTFSLCSGICVHCVTQVLLYTDFANNTDFKAFFVKAETDLTETRVICLPVGAFVFFLVLFTWHHIMRLCGRRKEYMFLDKVCIHQTDPKQKELGIKSIGGILFRTESVLIAWDTTYFERLWCVYELAAFKSCHPEGKIIFLPIMLGGAIAVFSIAAMLTEFFSAAYLHLASKSDSAEVGHLQYKFIAWGLLSTQMTVFISVARKYGRDLGLLKEQVARFTVHDSKCFCCENNHRNPKTQAELPCDRELVYASIAHWHGRGNEQKGLAKFDRLVQRKLREDIDQSLGGWSLVPYNLALSFSLWDALIWLDTIEVMKLDTFTKVLMVTSRLLSSTPFLLVIGFAAGLLFPMSATTKLRDSSFISFLKEQLTNVVLTAIVILVAGAHSFLRDHMALSGILWQKVVIAVIECIIPFLCFTQAGSRLIVSFFHSLGCIDAPHASRRSTLILDDLPKCNRETVEMSQMPRRAIPTR